MRASRLLAAVSSTLCCTSACSFLNHVDVCERPRPAISETNIRTEGSQLTDGARSIAPLSGGGSFLVFTSVTDPNNERTGTSSIRGMIVDPRGQSLRTCDAAGEFEYAADMGARLTEPSVAVSPARDELGLIVYVRNGSSVVGEFISQTGCLIPTMSSFVISGSGSCGRLMAGSFVPESPIAVPIGRNTFRVFWLELDSTARGTICTRDVTRLGSDPEFPATPLEPTGAPVAIVTPGNFPGALDVVPLDAGRTALIWLEVATTITGQLAIFDDRLTRVGDQRQLGTPVTLVGGSLEALAVAGAWDGSQLFAVWSEIRPTGTTELMLRVFDGMGRSLRTPLSDDGSPVRLADTPTGVEGRVRGSALHGGGALFTYERRSAQGGESVRTIDAVAFDANGGRRFVNPSCGSGAFQISGESVGSSRLPAMALTANDVVAISWTVDMAPGADRSGSSLRSTAFDVHSLLPVP